MDEDERQQKTIGAQVRAARKRKHMTQKQLAEAAGVSENTVIAIEKGRNSQELKLSNVMDALEMEQVSTVAERVGWPREVSFAMEVVGISLMEMPEADRPAAYARVLREMFRND